MAVLNSAVSVLRMGCEPFLSVQALEARVRRYSYKSKSQRENWLELLNLTYFHTSTLYIRIALLKNKVHFTYKDHKPPQTF